MTSPDWTKVSEKVARQIFEQAEKYLAGQLTVGLAADQRALTVASIGVGFSSAMFAATIGYWSSKGGEAILVSGLVAGSVMLLGAVMCAWAARPVEFFSSGNRPDQWWPVANQPLATLLGGESENYQEMILDNAKTMDKNATWLERGVVLSSLSPVAGVACWAAIVLFS